CARSRLPGCHEFCPLTPNRRKPRQTLKVYGTPLTQICCFRKRFGFISEPFWNKTELPHETSRPLCIETFQWRSPMPRTSFLKAETIAALGTSPLLSTDASAFGLRGFGGGGFSSIAATARGLARYWADSWAGAAGIHKASMIEKLAIEPIKPSRQADYTSGGVFARLFAGLSAAGAGVRSAICSHPNLRSRFSTGRSNE